MSEIDNLVTEKFVQFREAIVSAFRDKHPYVVGILESAFGNKENRVGLQVLDSGRIVGEYTFILKGIHIVNTEIGKIDPSVRHPLLGIVIKPYVLIEKDVMENLIQDMSYQDDLLGFITRILPHVTLKFMA